MFVEELWRISIKVYPNVFEIESIWALFTGPQGRSRATVSTQNALYKAMFSCNSAEKGGSEKTNNIDKH